MSQRKYLILSSIIVFFIILTASSIIVGFLNNVPTIVRASRIYWDRDIVLCPPHEIEEDVSWAVKQWNNAILYFSSRYLMIDLLNTKILVGDRVSKCNVHFNFFDNPLSHENFQEKICIEEDFKNMENLVVGYVQLPVNTNIDQPTIVDSATINLWRGLKGEHLRAVILHEIAVMLGLRYPIYLRTPPMRSASELWGSLDVTSIDIYALYLKNRKPIGETGRIVSQTPPLLSYITVGTGIWYDILSLPIASSTSLLFYKIYSKRVERNV